jgi:hypothetical protein
MYFLVFSVVWVRWTFPRTQFYGLLNLSWKILIPVSLVTLLLSGAMLGILKPESSGGRPSKEGQRATSEQRVSGAEGSVNGEFTQTQSGRATE